MKLNKARFRNHKIIHLLISCVLDCRYFITIDYSKIFRSPKYHHMCCLNIYTVSGITRQTALVRCSQNGLSTSPYESKLASG